MDDVSKEKHKKLIDDTYKQAREVFENLMKISKLNSRFNLAVVHMAGVIRQLDSIK